MAKEFRLPALGEGVGAGVVVKIPVSVGDVVKADQIVLEIETDKAVAEVPSTESGVIREIHVREGEEVQPGQLVFTLDDTAGASADEGPAETGKAAAEQEKAAGGGEQGASDRQEAAADKQEGAGDVREAAGEAGKGATDGDKSAAGAGDRAGEAAERAAEEVEVAPVRITESKPEADRTAREELAHIPAAPSTRRFAREIGVDISAVRGTGPGGRISIEDVKAYAKRLNEGRNASSAAGIAVGEAPLPDFSRWGEVERKPMSGVRRKTAEHLSAAWRTIPHVTQFDQADVTNLEALRQKYAPRVEKAGGKLTPTAIILKVVAAALKVFPQFNTSVDMAQGEIVYKKYCHIGVAVDTEAGLLVPVIRDVDKKNLVQLCVELTQVAEKARARKLSLQEMQGGCFTVSNLGGIGGTAFTPIVNAPEVAILGVSRSRIEPVFRNGAFEPRTIMPLALSYDHRVIDGADGARFLRWVVEALENPFLLTLEG